MDPFEFIVSLAITWTVILVPPVLLRWWRKRPFSKGAALGWTTGLFFLNDILFAAMTGRASGRTFLLVGAFDTWYVLRWRSTSSPVAAMDDQGGALAKRLRGWGFRTRVERERTNAEMYAKDRAKHQAMLEEEKGARGQAPMKAWKITQMLALTALHNMAIDTDVRLSPAYCQPVISTLDLRSSR